MNKKSKIHEIGNEVINLQIKSLKKLRISLTESFDNAVKAIVKCKSKVIICGVGKSGKIAAKIAATLSSVGTPSFCVSANDCSHGDLGLISKNDLLILISYSGNTEELSNIIKYAKFNKINLIGIVSNKDSKLYKASNIKLLIPQVEESGFGIVPTSSTTIQLCLGDALAIASMKKKKFGKFDFKKFHPAGNLGNKLKIASDIMLPKNRIPFVNENENMKDALNILNSKKLGFLVVRDNKGLSVGIFTDGDLKRLMQKKKSIFNLKIKNVMTKKPISVEKNTLATDILKLMNKKKITNVCVYDNKQKNLTIGIIHIHNLVQILK